METKTATLSRMVLRIFGFVRIYMSIDKSSLQRFLCEQFFDVSLQIFAVIVIVGSVAGTGDPGGRAITVNIASITLVFVVVYGIIDAAVELQCKAKRKSVRQWTHIIGLMIAFNLILLWFGAATYM